MVSSLVSSVYVRLRSSAFKSNVATQATNVNGIRRTVIPTPENRKVAGFGAFARSGNRERRYRWTAGRTRQRRMCEACPTTSSAMQQSPITCPAPAHAVHPQGAESIPSHARRCNQIPTPALTYMHPVYLTQVGYSGSTSQSSAPNREIRCEFNSLISSCFARRSFPGILTCATNPWIAFLRNAIWTGSSVRSKFSQ